MRQRDRFAVCAGWLPGNPVIGLCHISRARGAESISFEYNADWLVSHPNLCLDPKLAIGPGRQYPFVNKTVFGFLSDAAPDRWGRRLMDRRERLAAKEEKRAVRKLMESNYILGVHDGGRSGGLRFMDPQSGVFLSDREELAAPPIAQLRELQEASMSMERGSTEEEKWLRMLFEPGSSLGGARPKANVVDEDGSIWIAKFPSRNDEYNVGAWEMVAHDLAKRCGLRVPPARVEHFSEFGDTFLVKRFDRIPGYGETKRIHFCSAMTMLEQTDDSDERSSYLDILGLIEAYGNNVAQEALELWKRLIFNICISNTDDHLRNHGFLLRQNDTWELSPCYDVNPQIEKEHLSLAVDFEHDDADIELAIETAEYYRLKREEAVEIAEEIKSVIRGNWRYLAKKYHIPRTEQENMAIAFRKAEETAPPR